MNCVLWKRMATLGKGRQAASGDLWDCGGKGLLGYHVGQKRVEM